MSEQLAPISVMPGVLTKETLPLGIVALKVSNTSPYDLSYSGYGASGDDVIPSGVENILYGAVYNSGVFQTTLVNNRNITPANAGVVLLVAYYSDSEVPQGSWPVSIPTSTVNVSGNTGVTTSQFLQNDTSNAGTVFIESTVGANQATKVTVDGIWNLSIIIAGVLHKLLTSQTSGSQLVLGQPSDIVEVASNLIADGTLSAKGASSFDNGNAFTDGLGNFTIQDILINTTLQVLGATHLDSGNISTDGAGGITAVQEILSSDLFLQNQKLSSASSGDLVDWTNHTQVFLKAISSSLPARLIVGVGSRQDWTIGSIKAGTASGTSGTVTHNMNIPNVVIATPSISGSATVGVTSITNTSFHWTIGTGSGIQWLVIGL